MRLVTPSNIRERTDRQTIQGHIKGGAAGDDFVSYTFRVSSETFRAPETLGVALQNAAHCRVWHCTPEFQLLRFRALKLSEDTLKVSETASRPARIKNGLAMHPFADVAGIFRVEGSSKATKLT